MADTISCVICDEEVSADDEYYVKLRLHINAMHFSTYLPFQMRCCERMFGDPILMIAGAWCCEKWRKEYVLMPEAHQRSQLIEAHIDMFTNHSILKKKGSLQQVIDRINQIVKDNPIEDLPTVQVPDESVDELLQQIERLKAEDDRFLDEQLALQRQLDAQSLLNQNMEHAAVQTASCSISASTSNETKDDTKEMAVTDETLNEQQPPSSTLTQLTTSVNKFKCSTCSNEFSDGVALLQHFVRSHLPFGLRRCALHPEKYFSLEADILAHWKETHLTKAERKIRRAPPNDELSDENFQQLVDMVDYLHTTAGMPKVAAVGHLYLSTDQKTRITALLG